MTRATPRPADRSHEQRYCRSRRQTYATAATAEELAKWIREDRVRGVAENPVKHTEDVPLPSINGSASPWKASVSYGLPSFWSARPAPGNKTPQGEALLISLGPDEFLVTGTHCRVDFSAVAAGRQRMWITVEEGVYKHGVWQRTRLWNGDQTDYGLNFNATPQLLRVRLAAY